MTGDQGALYRKLGDVPRLQGGLEVWILALNYRLPTGYCQTQA